MKRGVVRYLPVAVWLIALALSVAYSAVAVGGTTSLGDAASALMGVTFSTVGVIVASKRPDNRVGWIFLGIGVSLALNGFSFTYADHLREHSDGTAWHWWAWVGTWSWLPGFLLLFPTLFLVFPDGRIAWKRGRTFLRITAFGALLSLMGTIPNPADLPGVKGYENPLGIGSLLDPLDYMLVIGSLIWLPTGLFASVRGLYVRFRSSSGVEREQLKWFVFAGFATVLMYVVGSSFYNLMGSTLGGAVALIGVPLLPAATAIAILRYRLYDIDRLVNRAIVYTALSIVLAGVYLAIVVLLQSAVAPLAADSDIAVAASTLAVAALFRPVRTRLQDVIDHSFYRRRYNATETLQSFSGRLRDQVDLEMLTTDLVSVVGSVMQPAHVSVWLKQEARS